MAKTCAEQLTVTRQTPILKMLFSNFKLLFCQPVLSYEGGSSACSALHILLKDGDE